LLATVTMCQPSLHLITLLSLFKKNNLFSFCLTACFCVLRVRFIVNKSTNTQFGVRGNTRVQFRLARLPFRDHILLGVRLITGFSTAAVKCYDCNSVYHVNCGSDNFSPEGLTIEDDCKYCQVIRLQASTIKRPQKAHRITDQSRFSDAHRLKT